MKTRPEMIQLSYDEVREAINEWLAKKHPNIKPVEQNWPMHPLAPDLNHLIQIEVQK